MGIGGGVGGGGRNRSIFGRSRSLRGCDPRGGFRGSAEGTGGIVCASASHLSIAVSSVGAVLSRFRADLEKLVGVANFCDVSLPVPLDQSFTYQLPETLWHRAQPGCRVLVPFGSRKLTGVILKVHDQPPEGPAKEVLRLLDEQPALDQELMALVQWSANYYFA